MKNNEKQKIYDNGESQRIIVTFMMWLYQYIKELQNKIFIGVIWYNDYYRHSFIIISEKKCWFPLFLLNYSKQ